MDDLAEQYREALSDLTFNSKPLINTLSMIADENRQYASVITKTIEEQTKMVSSPEAFLIRECSYFSGASKD
jgi:hypothetical protein